MFHRAKRAIGVCLALLTICAPVAAQSQGPQASGPTPAPGISVPGQVALGSLVALSDGYLVKLADSLAMFASTETAKSANWEQIRPPLAALADRNVDALVWFALPDGRYWSVQEGRSSGNLSDRPYFPRALSGETVIGPLVVSRATGKSSAIVAVPVRNADDTVVGVLGASIYLDRLSARLNREMSITEDMIFYSFDAAPLLALEWDPQLILVDPFTLGPEIRSVFEYMLSRAEGTIRYRWANRWRTVMFRKSQVTGWWYAVGVVAGQETSTRPR